MAKHKIETKKSHDIERIIMTVTVIVSFVLIIGGALIFREGESKFEEPIKVNTTGATLESVKETIDGNNKFALELYFKLNKNQDNIFFSPYSISSALSMTYEGAKGKTAEEMQKVIQFPKEDEARRSSYAKIYEELNKKDKVYELNSANALWAQENYSFLPEYFKTVEQYYGGRVTNLDFVLNADESRIMINNWVADKTNNKIKDLISADMINPMTRLILTNVIYFKGKWVKQFEQKNTYDADFYIENETKIKVKMMNLNDKRFNYSSFQKLQIIELPYEGNELSMFVLLPKKDIEDLESSLDLQNLEIWEKNMKEKEVDVYLPKFKFEEKYLLNDKLKSMGMVKAFLESADFSGMTGNKDLFIAFVVHQAFVEVDEEGTQAAAATGVGMKETAAPLDSDVFRADRPFIFIIQQKESGNILFIGRVVNPNL